ncbi:MAG: glycosyltransferase [Mucilaginibacter sp.]|nr:glycosyltransferase [Mucilaginibacter sp.]
MTDKNYRLKVYEELSSVLSDHKANFISKGVKLPLQPVPCSKNGLLTQLPCINGKTGWPWSIEVDPSVYQAATNWPKITVVIPSYNQGEFIEEAIRSALLQNYPNLELIVMDGGSTDRSKEVLNQYAPWISYWQGEKDNGQGQAINMGFSIASGDYYGWLNSDDFYNERALLVLGKEILETGKEFYYGDALSTNEDNTVQNYWKAFWVTDGFLRYGGVIASHSAFWSRSIHQPIWEKMNCNVDGELWIRLVEGRRKKHIRFPLGTIRSYDDTKSASLTWKSKWKEDDINIEMVHGKPPTSRSFKSYLFRFVQRLYKKYGSHN